MKFLNERVICREKGEEGDTTSEANKTWVTRRRLRLVILRSGCVCEMISRERDG